HGHYQIEMDCNACHTPGMGVQQDACLNCHQSELKASRDTHSASKFKDPTNAPLLESLDVTKCTTCHEEHVESRTTEMGLSIPSDYCANCHQETLENRPSHKNFAFDSCSTSGCHNYHDNLALYENFLVSHVSDEELKAPAQVLARPVSADSQRLPKPDAPAKAMSDEVHAEWMQSTHADVGVNCRACHQPLTSTQQDITSAAPTWSDSVPPEQCGHCHAFELERFGLGHHGMRVASGLGKMTPGESRLPMHSAMNAHELDCNSCHQAHTDDTGFAAVDACLKCHTDEHSLAYKNSSHYQLWQDEMSGSGAPGSGVSCATCHMPRMEQDGKVVVDHNQNANLRPNEKMIRGVCLNCHSLQISLDALADKSLIANCFHGQPSEQVESIRMAQAWFELKEREKQERKKRRNQ
ncbi:MAG: ammonia-forming cytochrome c nitrite reductase subunit c552, partial [Planctomycetota bacterium]